ncbi:MAG: CYTH domain protein [Parcubacteria group bacterium ADurb.Bin316]|nr:MAG: CYTH domain protein [Parcubacteria group bacterium ADurb.Bin316]HOZ56000.1 CYTH domain-containing protein [bacterium]
MNIEYEATFTNVDKNEIRTKLKSIGAQLIKPEFLMKRTVFNLPAGHEINGGWLRVRDEGDKITMSLKVVEAGKIENQKEACLIVDDYQKAANFLEHIGCARKSYQETRRELWIFDDVEITIDEWPFLEPFVEVEGKSEDEVKRISEMLGFDYNQALFCAVDTLYSQKYGISEKAVDKESLIIFNNSNPFIK